ncbi:MAG: alpha/beta hydrolase fold protein [Actinoallomurus sp.]|nr:alpha/beta hydrolase fold protein [Actinoallomurus sp.]
MRINGKDYAVEIDGAGPPVLFIHGLGGTANFYQPQAEALAGDFQVIRPDLEGAGRTPLSGQAKLSITGWVDDLLALVEQLRLRELRIVGHSMGTLVAQELAIRLGDRVAALALLGAVKAPGEPGRKAQRERAGKVRAEGMIAVAPGIVAAATSETTRRDHPERAAFVRELLTRQPAEGYAQSCEALGSAVEPHTAKITAPLLLLTGEEDKVGTPATSEELAERVAQNAVVRVYDQVGHWTAVEAPRQVTQDLQKFL